MHEINIVITVAVVEWILLFVQILNIIPRWTKKRRSRKTISIKYIIVMIVSSHISLDVPLPFTYVHHFVDRVHRTEGGVKHKLFICICARLNVRHLNIIFSSFFRHSLVLSFIHQFDSVTNLIVGFIWFVTYLKVKKDQQHKKIYTKIK